jgi:hypothetical protein
MAHIQGIGVGLALLAVALLSSKCHAGIFEDGKSPIISLTQSQ